MKKLDWDRDVRNLLEIDVARCKGGYEEQPPDVVYDGGWAIQPKLDGMRKTIQIGRTKVWIVSRNREDKLKGVDAAGEFVAREGWGWTRELLDNGEEGTMLDGELCVPGGGVAEAMHAWSEKPTALEYVVFDCLFRKGENLRDIPYKSRLKHAAEAIVALEHGLVRPVDSWPASKKREKELMADGGEGVIFAKLDGTYAERRSRWKKKAQNPVDLIVMGCSEKMDGGSPKNGIKAQPTGRPAAAQVGLWKDGRLVPVGWMMNLADEDKALTMERFNRKYIGKVAEAVCSGWEGVRFRWARWVRWREDKSPKDCQFEDQVGEVSSNA